MANTLNTLTQLTDSANGQNYSFNKTITTTGDAFSAALVSVGTSEEEYTIPTEIGDAGRFVILNKDATNFVQVGFATTVYPLVAEAGESSCGRLAASTASLFLKADTAACEVLIVIYED